MKKLTAILLSALLLVSVFTVAASAKSNTVKVRIEGIDSQIYSSDYQISDGDTVLDVIKAVDAAEDTVTAVFDDYGFLKSVNGDSNAKFGGWDGWQYIVNNVSPSVSMGDYSLSGGEDIVIYYGDYPCALPIMDYSKAAKGIVSFKSENTDWVPDENGDYVPVTSVDPVTGAKVWINGLELTTDENGAVSFDSAGISGFVSVQISRYSESGAPTVLRYASDYGFVMPASASEDESTPDESTPDEPTESAEATETTEAAEPTQAPTESVEPTTEATEATTATESATATEPAQPTTAPVTAKPTAPKKTTSISVPAKKTLYVKGTYTIKSTAVKNPVGATTYTTSDKKVVKVNSKGKLTAVKKGTAVVTVKNNGVKKTIKVTVKNPKLNKKTVKLKAKKTFKIKVKGQAGKLTFKSSKKSIAKVSAKGVVKAKKKGKAVITVVTNGMKLKLKVTVK